MIASINAGKWLNTFSSIGLKKNQLVSYSDSGNQASILYNGESAMVTYKAHGRSGSIVAKLTKGDLFPRHEIGETFDYKVEGQPVSDIVDKNQFETIVDLLVEGLTYKQIQRTMEIQDFQDVQGVNLKKRSWLARLGDFVGL